jgi:hypothetical protein
MASIQNTHVVSTKGGTTMPLRTGYEKVIAQRVDDTYAYTADLGGEVVSVDKDHLRVRFENGEEERIPLGRSFGNVAGSTVPHDRIANVQAGQSFEAGEILMYNDGFFKPDPLDPHHVNMKNGVLVTTALMENSSTIEDASAISERVAQELETETTKVKTVQLRFDQVLSNLVQEGQEVDVESILCTIEDPVAGDSGVSEGQANELLHLMSTNAPTAKTRGRVERIEVFYNGDTDDMSDTVRELTVKQDRKRQKRLKAQGKTPTTGQVDGTVRIDKDPLAVDTLAIQFYITSTLGAGVGDKGVFANQMKTVFSNVLTGINETESGTPIDAWFGYASVSARVVLSPEIMGTTNTLLKLMSRIVAKTYYGEE